MILLVAIGCAGPVPPGSSLNTTPSGTPSITAAATTQNVTSVPPATPPSSATSSTGVTEVPVFSATSGSVTAVPATSATAGTNGSVTPAATATSASAPSGSHATSTPPASGFAETELKYRLIAQLGDVFYCDPDQYPVAHGGDQSLIAAGAVAAIKLKEPEKYQGILKHLGLVPSAALDSGQNVAVYQESKRLNAIVLTSTGDVFKFTLRVSDAASSGRSGFAIEGSVNRQGDIAVTKKDPAFLQCPICLAADAQIDTPAGPVAASALQVGMPVWTRDAAGKRVAGVVVQTAHVAVPATHQVVRLRLDDGRELRVSPGHPTTDGRRVGDLVTGDMLDGSRIASANREAYADGATFDLLPSGGTGTYWANGILLGSTLR